MFHFSQITIFRKATVHSKRHKTVEDVLLDSARVKQLVASIPAGKAP
jgi:hypothetical protein